MSVSTVPILTLSKRSFARIFRISKPSFCRLGISLSKNLGHAADTFKLIATAERTVGKSLLISCVKITMISFNLV